MLLIDPSDGMIIDANPAACKFYGYDLETLERINISQINTLPQDELAIAISQAVNGDKNQFQFQHRLANGEIRDVEVNSSPIEYQDTIILLSIVNDITSRKQAEKALGQKVDELLRFHNLTVDRELKMVELKKEINQLLQNADKPPRYKIIE